MQLIYEGKDISQDVEIRKANLSENAGGELDSLEVHCNDPKGLWSQWNPSKNHTVQVKQNGFDSGIFYADEILQQRGLITIKALPVKQEAKSEYTRAWDNIQLLKMAQEIATKQGLSLEAYEVENYLYSRVDQYQQTDLDFLSKRCILESCALKVTNGKLVIFSEPYMESQGSVKTIFPSDIDGDYYFKIKSSQIFGSCKVSARDIQYEYKATNAYGPTFKAYDIPLGSLEEARRFAKGLLRAKNKYEQTFLGTIRFDAGISAGNVVALQNYGLADGNYFVYQVTYKFDQNKMVLKLRRALEG